MSRSGEKEREGGEEDEGQKERKEKKSAKKWQGESCQREKRGAEGATEKRHERKRKTTRTANNFSVERGRERVGWAVPVRQMAIKKYTDTSHTKWRVSVYGNAKQLVDTNKLHERWDLLTYVCRSRMSKICREGSEADETRALHTQ